MKNIAIIFAGGSGSRMKTVSKPKQFLELNGKPVIIYTLELFDNHPEIDGIVVVCIEPWISFLMKQLKKFEISKVGAVVPGGKLVKTRFIMVLLLQRILMGRTVMF